MLHTNQVDFSHKNFTHFRDGVEVGQPSSSMMIPAIKGEFYDYSACFSEDRPIYALLKCKSQKSWRFSDTASLGFDANLFFSFKNSIRVCSVDTLRTSGIFDKTSENNSLGSTWVATTGIATQDFYEIRARMYVSTMVEICRKACLENQQSITVKNGEVIAMMTDSGKFGMFTVSEIKPEQVTLDACHIQL